MLSFKSIWPFGIKKKRPDTNSLPPPADYFDAAYYLETYTDVQAAGIDPWHHFYYHGRVEGRWPALLNAVTLELQLWSQSTQTAAEQQLHDLVQGSCQAESTAAAWFLGRWYASQERWVQVVELMPYFNRVMPIPGHLAPALLWADALRHAKSPQAHCYLEKLQAQFPACIELAFIAMNFDVQAKLQPVWWEPVNAHYTQQGLATLGVNTDHTDAPLFDQLISSPTIPVDIEHQPLVSIIVPTYNAEQTLTTVIKGLLNQSWSQLEILIVDDASTDNTVVLAKKWAEKDRRIRVIKQESNQGAYITRNRGAQLSQGEFITVHDSDDWSHPQKIEQQIKPLLKQSQLQATLSHWIRASNELEFGGWNYPTNWESLVHRNVSSLLMRRRVFEELGYWDRVVCSADTEYYYRIIAAYGATSLYEVQAGLPLAFGRLHAESLTQKPETNIFSVRSGLRHDYRLAYEAWHTQCQSIEQLYMPQYPATRLFPVSSKMLCR